MANEFHICVIKLAKYEELRPAAYGVKYWCEECDKTFCAGKQSENHNKHTHNEDKPNNESDKKRESTSKMKTTWKLKTA